MIPTLAELRRAYAATRAATQETPLLEAPALAEATGAAQVFVKPESLQWAGSFKVRGALWRLLQLSPEERARGVVAYSSGNFAQGLAAAGRAQGVPVTKTMYAGRALYTAESIGFTILTNRTALFGNQTGIRRSLDRIKEGTAKRELPPWATKVLNPGTAPFAFGSNLKENPVPNALRSKLPFLDGVETVAVVGNFAPPGVNLAGTLVYPDETTAKTGASKVSETRAMLDTYTPFLALLGIPKPVQKLEADAVGKEGHFVAGIDAVALSAVLARLDDLVGALPKAPPVSQ